MYTEERNPEHAIIIAARKAPVPVVALTACVYSFGMGGRADCLRHRVEGVDLQSGHRSIRTKVLMTNYELTAKESLLMIQICVFLHLLQWPKHQGHHTLSQGCSCASASMALDRDRLSADCTLGTGRQAARREP